MKGSLRKLLSGCREDCVGSSRCDGWDRMPGDSLARYTRRIVFANGDEPAYRIIQRLRAARLGLAAVLDSQKKLVGIVTGEDMIKRLVQSV